MRRFFFLLPALLLIISACGNQTQSDCSPLVKNYELLDLGDFESAILSSTPKIVIYLPEDYETSSNSYPVLYAHDGQNLFDKDTAFSGEWRLDENIEALQEDGNLSDLIVVGVYNRGSKRILDYTPTEISNEYVNNDGGGLSNYALFLVNELIPFINENFRTLTDAENTGTLGSSLGGLISFYLAGWYPEVFGRAAVISPSFWWDDVRVTNDLLNMKFNENQKIYIDGGWLEGADESGMCPLMRVVHEDLLELGLKDFENIFYYEDPAGLHNEATWAKRGKMPLLYLFGNFDATALESEILLSPDELGIGDESLLVLQIDLPNEMKFTSLSSEYESQSTAVRIEGSAVTGVSAGTALLSCTDFDAETEVTVLSHSRDFTEVTITATGEKNALTLEVYMDNGVTTNYLIPMEKSEDGYILTLLRSKGEGLRFKVIDENESYAVKESGSVFKKNLTFQSDMTAELELYWED